MDHRNDFDQRLAITTEALRKCEERALAGQFALEIMHEVRNPLDALGNLLSLAKEEEDIVAIRSYLSQANEQMATVHQIADQTLSLARSASLAREVDLTELAEAALRIHHRRIQSQRIHLVRDFSKGAVADVHTGEILQVVSNLLANALDAMSDGGNISLRIRKRGARVQVLVADSGHGMKPEHLEDSSSHSSLRRRIEAQVSVWLFQRKSLNDTMGPSPHVAASIQIARAQHSALCFLLPNVSRKARDGSSRGGTVS